MAERPAQIDGGAWTRLVATAGALAERARTIFERPRAATTPPAPPVGADALAALEVRAIGLEKRVDGIAEEVVASFEVVKAITEQHSQLVQAVDVLLARTRFLGRACIALAAGIAAVALLAVAGWMR